MLIPAKLKIHSIYMLPFYNLPLNATQISINMSIKFLEMPLTSVLITKLILMKIANFTLVSSWLHLWKQWLTLYLPWTNIQDW